MVLSAALAVAVSQVAIAHPPDFDVMLATVKEARARRPLDAKALVAIKQGKIDSTLAVDLLTNDWLRAGSWSFVEKSFSARYEPDDETQFDFVRYLPDGQELSFSYQSKQQQVTHVNFTLPSPQLVSFKQVGKETYLERIAYGARELHRVVSYEKGVLILDISYDGVPRSKKVKFRDVWIAMPKRFESNGT